MTSKERTAQFSHKPRKRVLHLNRSQLKGMIKKAHTSYRALGLGLIVTILSGGAPCLMPASKVSANTIIKSDAAQLAETALNNKNKTLVRLAMGDNPFGIYKVNPYKTGKSRIHKHKPKKHKGPTPQGLCGKVPYGFWGAYAHGYAHSDQGFYDDEYWGAGHYRTMCVRLKDGYYWPINFAQQGRKLGKDNIRCQKSCSDPVRLYYMPSTSDNIAHMRDLKGRQYKYLETAFLYRKVYVKDAKCKPEPWSDKAKLKHAAYAKKDAGRRRRQHVATTKRLEKRRVAIMKRLKRLKNKFRNHPNIKSKAAYRRKKKYRQYSNS